VPTPITNKRVNLHSTMRSCTSRPWRSIKVNWDGIFYAAFLWSYIPVDLPPGQKVKLAELKALAANDEEMQNLTKQQEQEFIDKLVEFREHKTTSARANNAAAARDMLCTSDSINTQVSHQRA
jgi:hypothetical protein